MGNERIFSSGVFHFLFSWDPFTKTLIYEFAFRDREEECILLYGPLGVQDDVSLEVQEIKTYSREPKNKGSYKDYENKIENMK